MLSGQRLYGRLLSFLNDPSSIDLVMQTTNHDASSFETDGGTMRLEWNALEEALGFCITAFGVLSLGACASIDGVRRMLVLTRHWLSIAA